MSDYNPCSLLIPKVYRKIEMTVVNMLLKLDIRTVPIDPFLIVKKMGYILKPVSSDVELKQHFQDYGGSGCCCRNKNGVYYIVFNDKEIIGRQRFTVMHEIGHILLGHKEKSDLAEQEANCFASYALAPSPLIAKYGCDDYIDIANKFNVTPECAINIVPRYRKWMYDGGNKDYEKELLKVLK